MANRAIYCPACGSNTSTSLTLHKLENTEDSGYELCVELTCIQKDEKFQIVMLDE